MLRRGEQRVVTMREEVFPAPTRGWVQAGNLVSAPPDAAEVLDNFFVTAQGARLRGGTIKLSSLGSACVRLFTYASSGSEVLFASTETDIFNATTATSVRGSLTSGDWSTTQMTTAAGQFLVGVNGADIGWTYNGAFADLSISGVSASDLSHVSIHKRRMWFVEEGTTSAWYLPVDSIGGAATEFLFGPVFAEGGSLLFTASWSLDSGTGLDDVFLAVSDQGEVAVYEGTDPSSGTTWSLTGVYKIGKPLNKHAYFRAGGDLAILTEDGIVPVSEALRKDRAALQANAISAPIDDAWKDAIANRTREYPITATLWQSQSLLIIGTPSRDNGRPVAYAAYAQNGAWSRIVGWDIRCSVVYADDFYFGTADGDVFRGDVGGTDNGTQYTAIYVPKFSYSAVRRGALTAGLTYRAQQELDFDLHAHADYQVDDMPPVSAALVSLQPVPAGIGTAIVGSSFIIPSSSTVGSSTWGTGIWGTFVWGASGTTLRTFNQWQTVRAFGYALAPAVKIASNQAPLVEFEIIATRLRSEQGHAL